MPLHGMTALRALRAKSICKNDAIAAIEFAARKGWSDRDEVVRHIKAAVGGLETGSTNGPGFSYSGLDFMAALRPLTVVGRMKLRQVSPRMSMLTQVVGTRAYWVKRGSAIPVTAGTFSRTSLELLKVAALTVATDEMLADDGIGEAGLLEDLVAACVAAMDAAFLDIANVGVANEVPASITSTATMPIVSSGSTIDDLDADLADALQQLIDAGSNLQSAAWVLHPKLAARMALARGSSGAPAYPGLGALGGSLVGLPVLVSAANETEVDSDGTSSIALIDGSMVNYAEGEPALRSSKDATIEMSNTPTGNTITPAAATAQRVSMFESDATALLATLRVNWSARRAGAAQVITGARLDLGA